MTRAKQLLAALLSIVLVTSVGLVGAGGFVGAQTQEDGGAGGTASIAISDQPSDGQTVIVDNVTLPEGGFVVLHDAEELEGEDGDGDAVDSVIGVSTYLESGTHEDVPVTVGEGLDTTEVEVTAMAHQDTNGNEVFDFVVSEGEVDGAYTTGGAEETATATETETEMTETETATETTEGTETEPGIGAETETETGIGVETTTTEGEFQQETATETETETEADDEGEPVTDTATIDAIGDRSPPTNLEFSDQSSDGTTVTVDRVTLYRGGYLVIHATDEDGEASDEILGHSGYMEPGTYEDVEITLAQPLEFEDGESENVTVMPHLETNQNLVFDYQISMEAEDGPYTENETPVTETATISSEGGAETETETEMTETETATETTEGTETEPGIDVGTETTTTPGAGSPTETTTDGF